MIDGGGHEPSFFLFGQNTMFVNMKNLIEETILNPEWGAKATWPMIIVGGLFFFYMIIQGACDPDRPVSKEIRPIPSIKVSTQ